MSTKKTVGWCVRWKSFEGKFIDRGGKYLHLPDWKWSDERQIFPYLYEIQEAFAKHDAYVRQPGCSGFVIVRVVKKAEPEPEPKGFIIRMRRPCVYPTRAVAERKANEFKGGLRSWRVEPADKEALEAWAEPGVDWWWPDS